MKLRWLGHACFEVTLGDATLITDPFDAHVGYPLPSRFADFATVSHAHGDHNHTDILRGRPRVFDAPGVYDLPALRLRAVPTFHDECGGAKRGLNLVFVLEAEDLRIVHMGDIGHMLSPEQLAEIGRPDVLLLPVGGYYTVDAAQANQIRLALNARVTIPMHYQNEFCRFPITGREPFLRLAGGEVYASDTLEVTRHNIATLPAALALPLYHIA